MPWEHSFCNILFSFHLNVGEGEVVSWLHRVLWWNWCRCAEEGVIETFEHFPRLSCKVFSSIAEPYLVSKTLVNGLIYPPLGLVPLLNLGLKQFVIRLLRFSSLSPFQLSSEADQRTAQAKVYTILLTSVSKQCLHFWFLRLNNEWHVNIKNIVCLLQLTN